MVAVVGSFQIQRESFDFIELAFQKLTKPETNHDRVLFHMHPFDALTQGSDRKLSWIQISPGQPGAGSGYSDLLRLRPLLEVACLE